MSFQSLTAREITNLHDVAISRYGGSPGVRSLDALEGAIGRADARMTYGSGDPIEATVAVASGIVLSHPFIDGNKRTALLTIRALLTLNGFNFEPKTGTEANAMVWLASGRWSEAEFLAWVRNSIR